MPKPPDFTKTVLLKIPPELQERGGGGRAARSAAGTRKASGRDSAAATIGNASLQALFRNVYDAAFITDLAGVVVDANPRAAAAFGFSVAELCERTIPQVIPGCDAAVMRMVCENLEKDQFTLIQAFCVRKDGTEFPAEISTSRIRLDSGEYLCFFVRDVTTRKEAEQQLQNAHDELAVQVQQRTRLNVELNAEIAVRKEIEEKLRAAILKLQEHDQARTVFVSNVSHELKTPLASIHYLAGNLLRGVAEPLGERARGYVEMIRADCYRLARTVEDILDISRAEAKALRLRNVKIQFPRFVHKAAESMRLQVESAGLEYKVQIEAAPVFVHGDPQKLERVLFNTIRNAVKFNVSQGSVEVVLRADPERAGFLLLEVIDTGIGIEPQYLSRITDRFFRVGEYASGAGLGLSICKELIEHHGGTIAFQSPPAGRSRGTLVAMRLPVASPATILIATDHADGCGRLSSLMSASGYRVEKTGLGAGFEAGLAAVNPDLVALDWRAAGLEAAGVISTVKRSESRRVLPILALVEAGDMQPVKQEIICGFGLPVLREPWDDEECHILLDLMIMGRKDSIL